MDMKIIWDIIFLVVEIVKVGGDMIYNECNLIWMYIRIKFFE